MIKSIKKLIKSDKVSKIGLLAGGFFVAGLGYLAIIAPPVLNLMAAVSTCAAPLVYMGTARLTKNEAAFEPFKPKVVFPQPLSKPEKIIKSSLNAFNARIKAKHFLIRNFENAAICEFCGKNNAFADLLKTNKLKVVYKTS
ncbi:MAG: hypothetical protein GY793_02265 [Proteobacteria bacterium]|nr:hypothetical protein [Pseudomonadota bacterium]